MEQIQKTQIRYKDAPGKVVFALSGVYGGNNYQGQILANFYVEQREFPEIQLSIDSNQKKAVETRVKQDDDGFVREVVATAVLDPQIAIAVGNWLVNHGTSLRDQLQGKNMVEAKIEQ